VSRGVNQCGPIRGSPAELNRFNGSDQRTYVCKFHTAMVERPLLDAGSELVTT